MIGAIDMDFIDFDIDVDGDIDVDTSGGSPESGVAWLNKVLAFFNLGRIPFMVWLSIYALIVWIGVVIINFILGFESFIPGLLILLPVMLGAFILIKPLTFPLVKLFDALEKDEGIKSAIGKIGTVILPGNEKLIGQVDINDNGTHMRIYVKPASEEIILFKNQEVLVIQKLEDENVYLVEPYNT